MFTQMVFIPPFHARHRGHSSKVVPVTLYSRGKSLIGFDPRSSVDGSNLLRINILVRNGEGTLSTSISIKKAKECEKVIGKIRLVAHVLYLKKIST